MKVLVRDTHELWRHEIERDLSKDASRDETLDYLFDTDGEFVIRRWAKDKRTRLQRANILWVIPVSCILAPFHYVWFGHIGWDTTTKVGRWILRITGNLKEIK